MSRLSIMLGELLIQQKLMLAVAESCTGGLLASEITAVSGASHYFERGFVTYSNMSKHELLDVSLNTLQTYGAVSLETAKAMALGVLTHSHADVGVSITGVAGPSGGSEAKPVGFVCFGIADKKGYYDAQEQHFSGDRSAIREQAVSFALQWLVDYVLNLRKEV